MNLRNKYFIRNKINDEIVQIEILEIKENKVVYKDLQKNHIVETLLENIEKITNISEEEYERLNNENIFSVQTELIRCIVSREEIIKFSKTNFQEINKDEKTVLISITDPDRELLDLNILNQFKDCLSLQFWDLEYKIGNYEPITKEQGKILRNFILKNIDNNFVIHCEAGISRSAGVGLAIECLKYFGETEDNLYDYYTRHNSKIRQHNRYEPNLFVFDSIIKQ